jgi:hypothetical protein
MPKIQWSKLSQGTRNHLLDRARERKITAIDLQNLKLWIDDEPEVPDGKWYKDFGTFKLCGEGDTPSTFLEAHHSAYGVEVD